MLGVLSRPAKIDSGTFSAWMTALKGADSAVLLLIDFNSEGVRGMRAAAAAAGIDDSRIVSVPAMSEGKPHFASHNLVLIWFYITL